MAEATSCNLLAMHNALIAWLVAMMVQIAPPERVTSGPQFSGWEETAEQRLARYEEIAAALYEVTYDKSTNPIFAGNSGRAKTAALILSIAYFESGFARDVDIGPCAKTKNGQRCDGGRSACMMQVQIGSGATYQRAHGIDGLTQQDLFADRETCFRVGLNMIRRSFTACRKLGPDMALNVYASGSCQRGQRPGLARLSLARRLLAQHPVPGLDVSFLRADEIAMLPGVVVALD